MDVDQLKNLLGLEPLPEEGGFFTETYRSTVVLPAEAIPADYGGARCASTAIYYLLTPDTFSALHRLPGDEIFHFYLGDAVELLELRANGEGRVVHLGPDLRAGMKLQHVIEAGTWQGSRLARGGRFALLGVTVAPGFEFQDYCPGDRDELVRAYPELAEMIRSLTR